MAKIKLVPLRIFDNSSWMQSSDLIMNIIFLKVISYNLIIDNESS